jgi:hypothetical protein
VNEDNQEADTLSEEAVYSYPLRKQQPTQFILTDFSLRKVAKKSSNQLYIMIVLFLLYQPVFKTFCYIKFIYNHMTIREKGLHQGGLSRIKISYYIL